MNLSRRNFRVNRGRLIRLRLRVLTLASPNAGDYDRDGGVEVGGDDEL